MVVYKTNEEIELLREAALLVSRTHEYIAQYLRPGITGLEVDKLAEEYIRDNGGVPAFLNYNGFPNTLCISINDVVVHGIPTKEEFQDKDIVSIDCGVFLNNYVGDSAFTYAFSSVSEDTMQLLRDTNDSLYVGIEKAVQGNRMGDIGHAIQDYTEKKRGYGVVRELVGHGVGTNLHEPPEVPNYGRKGSGVKLKEGLVLAIEPMINAGTKKVKMDNDGWTIRTYDGKPSAHFEHTVAVRKDSADILSDHTMIEKAIKNNDYLIDFPIFI